MRAKKLETEVSRERIASVICGVGFVPFAEHTVEADLQEHIHLENNILFPKVLALEKGSCDVCQGFNNQDTGDKT